MSNYRWNPKRLDDVPLKEDDHGPDAAKVFYMGAASAEAHGSRVQIVLQDNISFDLTVNIADVAMGLTWPPRRFSERDERIETLNALWRGDFSSFKIKYEVSCQLLPLLQHEGCQPVADV